MALNKKFNVGENIHFAQLNGLSPAPEEKMEEKPIPEKKISPMKEDEPQPVEKNKPMEESVKSRPEKTPVPSVIVATPVSSVAEPVEPVEPVEKDIAAPIVLNKKKKETRSVHKNFLITKSLDEKLSKLASDLDVSQNDLINDILTQVFNSLE